MRLAQVHFVWSKPCVCRHPCAECLRVSRDDLSALLAREAAYKYHHSRTAVYLGAERIMLHTICKWPQHFLITRDITSCS